MIKLLHPHNQRWLHEFANAPRHAAIVELNHPLEKETITQIFSELLGVPGPIEVNQAALKIEDVRQMQHLAKLRKSIDERHLFVLDVTAGASVPAQNSLLKVLEEPPANTHILLITESANQLLPTIRSRSQLLRVLPLDDVQFKEQTAANFTTLDEATVRARAAAYHSSFAATYSDVSVEFDTVREFLRASPGERLRQVKNFKERPLALKLLDDLLLLSSQTQRHTARQGKSAATATWLRITAFALAAHQSIEANGNVSLHLQLLSLRLPTV